MGITFLQLVGNCSGDFLGMSKEMYGIQSIFQFSDIRF